jgi:hypothetical protein
MTGVNQDMRQKVTLERSHAVQLHFQNNREMTESQREREQTPGEEEGGDGAGGDYGGGFEMKRVLYCD